MKDPVLLWSGPAQVGEGIRATAYLRLLLKVSSDLLHRMYFTCDAIPPPRKVRAMLSLLSVTFFRAMTSSWIDRNYSYLCSPCVVLIFH